ncbi:hypothetical protein B0H11DRAFT_2269959 [Mycena galericulata]|nr:hypothetical protein B0H11DRAFT_2269959 [Mycena galericulata]
MFSSIGESKEDSCLRGRTSFPSEFAVEPAGKNTFKIKLPGEDEVAAAVFDGSSPIYGRVALEPAGDRYEEWIIQEL